MKQKNKIVNLKNYDLVLSYSFGVSERPCTGHIFECIEYFHILKNHFNCCIMIGDCIDFEKLLGNILEKYNFTDDEIDFLIDHIVVAENPNIVIGNNLLLVDGNFKRLKNKMIKFDKYFCFPCGVLNENDYPDYVTILGDYRIYGFNSERFVDYKKKMLFSKMVLDKNNTKYDYMMYITSGPREVELKMLQSLVDKYTQFGNTLVIYTDYNIKIKNDLVEIKQVPVEDVFNFKTYIYTSIERKFDCSPRFIIECLLNGKDVQFELNYPMIEDKGLYYRHMDSISDFPSLELKDDDEIIKILKTSI